MRILFLFSLTGLLFSQIQLVPYPQKIVTRYQFNDPRLPQGVMTGHDLEIAGAGVTWKTARRGLVREEPARPPRQYFNGRRYLLDDDVQHIQWDAERTGVWVRTRSGVTHIAMTPMTLEEKARYFEQRLRARHDRHGYIADSALRIPGDVSSNQTHTNDNDGLWTAIYVGAQAFRYAVTKDPDAMARGKRAMEAMLFLEQVTGRSGLPARSHITRSENRGDGGVWHWTPDGQIEWKADTSSDEIVGHFYAFALAWDLLPDPTLRPRVAATARRMMDHIAANGWNLIDVHGQPTYWGRWSPEYFATPRGRADSPLNALELLSFLKVAHHITGESRYQRLYEEVAWKMGYAEICAQLNQRRHTINYSDEELAMLPFYLLFRYERDPKLRAVYERALDQWWENIQREHNPLWTFIYQTAKPRAKTDLNAAVETLYRIPMDLIAWRVENSWRDDIQWAGAPDRFNRREAATWLPPDERPVMKWNGNPFIVDGGNDGRREDDGAFFLLPYWMGRYEKLIVEKILTP
ncbi:MAG: hypothetical protein JNN08_14935 [Bryobacterales bacterium]|nr:hypothetical protein [Bryobacterales bacterium]